MKIKCIRCLKDWTGGDAVDAGWVRIYGYWFCPKCFTKPSKHIVDIGGVKCGEDTLFLISGPCVIEDEHTMLLAADKLAEVRDKLNIPVIYKSSFMKDNRSSLSYYMGPLMEQGMEILDKVKEQYHFPILTDIHYPSQAAQVSFHVDCIQIPAYLCMQSSLLAAAAETGKPINIKHGQFLAPDVMEKPIQKLLDMENNQIIITERGYAFGYNDLVVDMRNFYDFRKLGYPVVFDVTHSVRKYGIPSANPEGGARQYLSTLARAATAAGIDGIFIESHPYPEGAKCDASSQLKSADLIEFLKPIIELHNLEVSYR